MMTLIHFVIFSLAIQFSYCLYPPVALTPEDISTHSLSVRWRTMFGDVTEFDATISPIGESESAYPQYVNESYATWVDLVPGKNYSISIVAVNQEGDRSRPAVLHVTTEPMHVYNVRVSKFMNPVLAMYSVSENRSIMFPVYGAVLMWEGPEEGYHNGFHVDVNPPHGVVRLPVITISGKAVPQSKSKRRVVWDLTPGVEYQFTVRTKSNTRLSRAITVRERMPPEVPGAPETPEAIKITNLTPTSLVVSWNYPHRGIIDGYVVEIDPPKGLVVEPIFEMEKRRTIENLTPGTKFKLDVYSMSFDVLSFRSRSIYVKTPPLPPLGPVSASDVGTSSVVVSWRWPGNNIDYYEIVFFPTKRDLRRLRHRIDNPEVRLNFLEPDTLYSLLIYSVANNVYSQPLQASVRTAPLSDLRIDVSTTAITNHYTEAATAPNDHPKQRPFTSLTGDQLQSTTVGTNPVDSMRTDLENGGLTNLFPNTKYESYSHFSIPVKKPTVQPFPTTTYVEGRSTIMPSVFEEKTSSNYDPIVPVISVSTTEVAQLPHWLTTPQVGIYAQSFKTTTPENVRIDNTPKRTFETTPKTTVFPSFSATGLVTERSVGESTTAKTTTKLLISKEVELFELTASTRADRIDPFTISTTTAQYIFPEKTTSKLLTLTSLSGFRTTTSPFTFGISSTRSEAEMQSTTTKETSYDPFVAVTPITKNLAPSSTRSSFLSSTAYVHSTKAQKSKTTTTLSSNASTTTFHPPRQSPEAATDIVAGISTTETESNETTVEEALRTSTSTRAFETASSTTATERRTNSVVSQRPTSATTFETAPSTLETERKTKALTDLSQTPISVRSFETASSTMVTESNTEAIANLSQMPTSGRAVMAVSSTLATKKSTVNPKEITSNPYIAMTTLSTVTDYTQSGEVPLGTEKSTLLSTSTERVTRGFISTLANTPTSKDTKEYTTTRHQNDRSLTSSDIFTVAFQNTDDFHNNLSTLASNPNFTLSGQSSTSIDLSTPLPRDSNADSMIKATIASVQKDFTSESTMSHSPTVHFADESVPGENNFHEKILGSSFQSSTTTYHTPLTTPDISDGQNSTLPSSLTESISVIAVSVKVPTESKVIEQETTLSDLESTTNSPSTTEIVTTTYVPVQLITRNLTSVYATQVNSNSETPSNVIEDSAIESTVRLSTLKPSDNDTAKAMSYPSESATLDSTSSKLETKTITAQEATSHLTIEYDQRATTVQPSVLTGKPLANTTITQSINLTSLNLNALNFTHEHLATLNVTASKSTEEFSTTSQTIVFSTRTTDLKSQLKNTTEAARISNSSSMALPSLSTTATETRSLASTETGSTKKQITTTPFEEGATTTDEAPVVRDNGNEQTITFTPGTTGTSVSSFLTTSFEAASQPTIGSGPRQIIGEIGDTMLSTITPSFVSEPQTNVETTSEAVIPDSEATTNGGIEVTIQTEDGSIFEQNGFTTICRSDNITVLVDKKVIGEHERNFGPLYLNKQDNSSCRGVEYDTYYRYSIAPDILDCGTRIEVNETHVNFTNTISNARHQETWLRSMSDRSGTIIMGNRLKEKPMDFVRMKIWCTFPLDLNVSSKYPFLPQLTMQVINFNVSGHGQFSAVMQLYETDKYEVAYLTPPTLETNDTLYVGLSLIEAEDENTFMIVQTCWATPTNNPDHNEKYPIIGEGCPVPGSLNGSIKIYDNGQQKQVRWEGTVFKFVNYKEAWLHCEIKICFGEGCAPSCRNARSRRAVSRNTLGSPGSHVLSAGPVMRNGDDNQTKNLPIPSENAENTRGRNSFISDATILIIVSVLSIIIITSCIIIVCAVARYRRDRTTKRCRKYLTPSSSTNSIPIDMHGYAVVGSSASEDFLDKTRYQPSTTTFIPEVTKSDISSISTDDVKVLDLEFLCPSSLSTQNTSTECMASDRTQFDSEASSFTGTGPSSLSTIPYSLKVTSFNSEEDFQVDFF